LCERFAALDLPDLRIRQIKEKFGELRIYVDGGNEAVSQLIQEAKEVAGVTCEGCGQPGEGFEMRTLCGGCCEADMTAKRIDEHFGYLFAGMPQTTERSSSEERMRALTGLVFEAAWIAEIKQRHPTLLGEVGDLGITIGPGWRELVAGLFWELEALGQEGLRIRQVKEKFGALRVSFQGGNEAVGLVVGKAEAAAWTICEDCGRPSDGRESVETLCGACRIRRMKEREIQ
jgi:hypothetical protein